MCCEYTLSLIINNNAIQVVLRLCYLQSTLLDSAGADTGFRKGGGVRLTVMY